MCLTISLRNDTLRPTSSYHFSSISRNSTFPEIRARSSESEPRRQNLSPDLRIRARAGRAAISIPTHVFYGNHGIPENRVGYVHSKWKDFRDFHKFHFSGNPSPSLRLGPDLDQIWTRSGPDLDQIGTRSGPDLDQIGTRSGPDLDQIWTRLGPDWDQIGTRSGPKSDPKGVPKVTRNGTRNGPVSYLYGGGKLSGPFKNTRISLLFRPPADPGASRRVQDRVQK